MSGKRVLTAQTFGWPHHENQIEVHVSVRVPFEGLQRHLSAEQLRAFMEGIARVISAQHEGELIGAAIREGKAVTDSYLTTDGERTP